MKSSVNKFPNINKLFLISIHIMTLRDIYQYQEFDTNNIIGIVTFENIGEDKNWCPLFCPPINLIEWSAI